MAEYIEREAAKEAICTVMFHDGIRGALKSCIDDVPAADVKPVVRGKWIKIDKYDDESNVQCSSCLEEFDYIDGVAWLCYGYELPPFCPNCGADMRGHTDEES